jgi:hypothetical protein
MDLTINTMVKLSPAPQPFAGQLFLLHLRRFLDRALAPQRFPFARGRFPVDEPDRQPSARVSGAPAAVVIAKPPVGVVRDAAIEGGIGAAEKVDVVQNPPLSFTLLVYLHRL